MNNTLDFHWFENPDEVLILLEQSISKGLALKLKERYGYNKYILKAIRIKDIKFFYQLKENKPIRIKTLKKILNSLNLNYVDSNLVKAIGGSKFVFNAKFPIDLNKKESAILVAAFMSDGNNQSNHPFYANTDFLGDKILKTVQTFFPNIPWEIRNEKLRFHSILSRLLLKLEVPIVDKVLLNH